jgi:hypothetical protein
VVLVGVFDRMGVEDLGAGGGEDVIDHGDGFGPVGDRAVVEATPAQLDAEQGCGCLLLLRAAHPLQQAPLAGGHDEDRDLVAAGDMTQERRPTPKLDVVGVRPDRDHVHQPSLRATRIPREHRHPVEGPERVVGQFRPFAYIRLSVGSPKAVSRALLPRDRRLWQGSTLTQAATLKLT